MGQFHMEFSEEDVKENCRGIYCGYKLKIFKIKPGCYCVVVVVFPISIILSSL